MYPQSVNQITHGDLPLKAAGDFLWWASLRLLQRLAIKYKAFDQSTALTSAFQQALLANGTFEEAMLSLLGVDPCWARYGLVCYLAVSPLSVNFKSTARPLLQRLGLGMQYDEDFKLPDDLTVEQMSLLHEYAKVLQDPSLDWSCLLPMDWYPRSLLGTQTMAAIDNVDIDEASDNQVRGTALPFGFMMRPRDWRQKPFIELAAAWEATIEECSGYAMTDLFKLSDVELQDVNFTHVPGMSHLIHWVRDGRGWIDRALITVGGHVRYEPRAYAQLESFDDFLWQHLNIHMRHLDAMRGQAHTHKTVTCGEWHMFRISA